MRRDEQQGSTADPEAALPQTSSTTQAGPLKSSVEDNESEEEYSGIVETPRNGTTPRTSKPAADTIPLTHTPPQALDEAQAEKRGKAKPPLPRLMHPVLHKIPMQMRYAVYGVLSSALFMVMYNTAVDQCGELYVPSTIYAASYLVFIPVQHAMAACMVFGWPDRYIPSLTSNVPIGLTAIALGAYLTAYLDSIKFNDDVENMLETMGWLKFLPAHQNKKDGKEDSKAEIYTSFFVLVVTSFWSFLLSVVVNAPAEIIDKKEL